MGSGLSMRARHEITKKFAKQYAAASKNEKGKLLDEVCAITDWSRDNARRQIRAALKPRRVGTKKRQPRALKYSQAAIAVLHRVWAFAGGISGKYLAASMELQVMLLEAHEELVPGKAGYSEQVCDELLAMSPATIDRYLAPARTKDPLRGITTTTPGPLLRNSITARKAGDEIEAVPGFVVSSREPAPLLQPTVPTLDHVPTPIFLGIELRWSATGTAATFSICLLVARFRNDSLDAMLSKILAVPA